MIAPKTWEEFQEDRNYQSALAVEASRDGWNACEASHQASREASDRLAEAAEKLPITWAHSNRSEIDEFICATKAYRKATKGTK